MLNVLRHKGVAKKVLWFTTAIIILSFGFFGVANRLDHSINIAGKIYGKGISYRDFERAYMDSRQAAILMYGDQFFKYGNRLDLEGQTWDRLILLHEAKKRRIQVANQEIVDAIAAMPFFQTQGKFDQFKYQSILQDQRVFARTPHEFEEGMRAQLTIQKLLDQISGNPTVSEEDLKKEYTLKSQKIKLSYALFEPLKAAQNLNVTEEEIKEFYKSNPETFRKPEMVNVEYASLSYPQNATDQQKQAIKDQILGLSKDLKLGSDFKAIAQNHKIEIKESGLFSQAQPLLTFAWSPELVEKIFAMKQGEFSSALEAPDGWQIVHLKERKNSYVPEYEQVKEDAKRALMTNKGFSLAKIKADSALKLIEEGLKANKGFKELAEPQGAKVDQTPLFGRGEYIANMGLVAEFQEATLKLDMKNRLSPVITTSQGPAIIYLDSVEALDEKQYEAEKANFREMTLAQRRNQAIVSFITKLKIEANVQNMIDQKRVRR